MNIFLYNLAITKLENIFSECYESEDNVSERKDS